MIIISADKKTEGKSKAEGQIGKKNQMYMIEVNSYKRKKSHG